VEELVLTADKMTENIDSKGAVSLSGLYFNHDQATLKEESKASLNIIADYLSKNKSLQYLVVGHTDNTGSFEYNRKLSEDRAKSVITAIESLLGSEIANNLSPFGAAYAAPVDSNRSEKGRANNRRVELVLSGSQK
jgi:outer membrane protein OmpA-like peptidoglycan-associated protein